MMMRFPCEPVSSPTRTRSRRQSPSASRAETGPRARCASTARCSPRSARPDRPVASSRAPSAATMRRRARHLFVCLFLLANVAVAAAFRVERRTRGIAPLMSGATSLGTAFAVVAFTGVTSSVGEDARYANVVTRRDARTTGKRGEIPLSCSSHRTTGRFDNFTFVGDDGCVLRYFDVPRLFKFEIETSSAKAVWMHFVGDSDTEDS